MSAPRLLRYINHTVDRFSLDVGAIVTATSYKRLFRILDWDKPYVLEVKCYEPHTVEKIQPIFIDGRMGFTRQSYQETFRTRKIRLPSLTDCQEHMAEIGLKQQRLDALMAERQKELMTLAPKYSDA